MNIIKSILNLVVLSVLLSIFILRVSATDTNGVQLVDDLTPIIYPQLNGIANAIFTPELFGYETTVQIHHSLVLAVAFREPYAACHPKALSFFGTKDKIDSYLCKPLPKARTAALLFYYASRHFYPSLTQVFLAELRRLGVPPNEKSVDPSTPDGWAMKAAPRLIKYFRNDGWNAMGLDGKKTKFFPQRYADVTGYTPKNKAGVRPQFLSHPLRWQPLKLKDDGFGNYVSQNFITPHIGKTVRPLSMNSREWRHLKTTNPYFCPSRKFRMCARDRRNIRSKLMPQMLSAMRTTSRNTTRLFTSYWWDNKFISAGLFRPTFEIKAGLTQQDTLFSGLGELMAMHDASVMAWREKALHDTARPETILKRLYRGKYVRSFRGVDVTAGPIPVEEWEPIVRTMPHPEFPSGSSTICTAVLVFLEKRMKYTFGNNWKASPTKITFPNRFFPWIPVNGEVNLMYNNLEEAKRECGMSRIDAGLHFQPAVDAGNKLGKKIGWKTFETWRDLEEGRVPKHCHWCTKM